MGLTIHYSLRSNARSIAAVRHAVERLRQRSLDLPFKEVGPLIVLSGEECEYEHREQDDPLRWLLVQASQYIEKNGRHFTVMPSHMIAFDAWPGDGCESSNMGLCRYPSFIEIENHEYPFGQMRIRTGLSGWRWSSFCKTQYASNPQHGGVENFLRCHLSVVRLLDHARELGLLGEVTDESGFFDKRNVKALVQEVGEWNSMIAGFYGTLKDMIGEDLKSPISNFPDYEHLEADGRREEL